MMTNVEFFTPQIHEMEIVNWYGQSRAEYAGPQRYDFPLYLIGFSNRCGSNLLAEYMASTGHFALFEEHLNSQTVIDNAKAHGYATFADYLIAQVEIMTEGARLPGFKANWMQIQMLHRLGITRMFNGIRVIHLVRRKVIDQAISFLIAEQTNQWTSQQQRTSTAWYSFDGINERILGIVTSNDWIRFYSELMEIPRIEIAYEDLEIDPSATVQQVCSFAEKPLGGWSAPQTQISRQRDDLNDDFRSRYQRDAMRLVRPQ